MGADFIFAAGERITDPEAIKKKIDQLPTETLAACLEDIFVASSDLGDTREDMLDYFYNAVDYLTGWNRSTGLFKCEHGTEYVIAGGMTWGDDPEGCNEIWMLTSLGVI
ncbi:hypothetical protein IH601_08880 [Candidatus Bipolaricaulota bacterium]|nr:hypothetical protein [Candidatus Bipolaricaulota bacterium]